MRKIGLTLLTLTIALLSACGETPTTASADDARAALDGGGWAGSGHDVAENPGVLGSGHASAPEGEGEATTAANPGFGGSGN